MGHYISQYVIDQIPDRFFPRYQLTAGGDVLSAVNRASAHLLRTLAQFPPDSVTVGIRFVFRPGPDVGFRRRLSLQVDITSVDEGVHEAARLLIESGPLASFYSFRSAESCSLDWRELNAAIDIVRNEFVLSPLNAQRNVEALERYYVIEPFEAVEDNDFMELDEVLGQLIREPAVIDMRVTPAGIERDRDAHTGYLARLVKINRHWASREGKSILEEVVRDVEDSPWSSHKSKIEPLREAEPVADQVLRQQQRFAESLQRPHLMFHLRVIAKTEPIARLIASVVAESGFDEGSYRLQSLTRDADQFESRLPHSGLVQLIDTHDQVLGKHAALYQSLGRLGQLATAEELQGVFRLPVGGQTSSRCIGRNTDPPALPREKVLVFGWEADRDEEEHESANCGLQVKQLVKHAFISGVPGSGKTTCLFNLLQQLHKLSIPFMVIEPAKTEYRVLKTLGDSEDENAAMLARRLQVYSAGNEHISPFRHNPLELHDGVSVNEHIDNLFNCFKASMPLEGPMLGLIGEGLERVYEGVESNDPPLLSDLSSQLATVLEEKDYGDEVMGNIRSALDVRFGALIRRTVGKIFQCPHSQPSVSQLMGAYSIIEMDRLAPDQKCLLTLFVLTAVREIVQTMEPWSGDLPRLIIVLEEAHNVVGRVGPAHESKDAADPRSFAAEFVSNMLAELRALGIGVIVVDQLPSKVAPEVIKNTSTKLALRQVAMDDREELGASMLFDALESEEIARFGVGRGYFFTEGYHRSCRIRTPNLHEQLGLGESPLNNALLPYLIADEWFAEQADRRDQMELTRLSPAFKRFNEQHRRIWVSIKPLLEEYESHSVDVKSQLQIATRLKELRSEWVELIARFGRTEYRPLIGHSFEIKSKIYSPPKLRILLEREHRSVIEFFTNGCVALDRVIKAIENHVREDS